MKLCMFVLAFAILVAGCSNKSTDKTTVKKPTKCSGSCTTIGKVPEGTKAPTNPTVTVPTTKPATTKPGATPAKPAKPATTKPATKPVKPATTKPTVVKPTTTKPVKPTTTKPVAPKPVKPTAPTVIPPANTSPTADTGFDFVPLQKPAIAVAIAANKDSVKGSSGDNAQGVLTTGDFLAVNFYVNKNTFLQGLQQANNQAFIVACNVIITFDPTKSQSNNSAVSLQPILSRECPKK